MAHRLTLESLLRHTARTEQAAARLSRPLWLFGIGRERRFVQEIDRFMSLMHHLPQGEAQRATPEQEAEMRRSIDAIIESVERFLTAHPTSGRSRLERNQRLASCIYDLRRSFEAIVRGATPNPHIVDVKREETLSRAHE